MLALPAGGCAWQTSSLELETGVPPWSADAPIERTVLATRQRFGSDGYDAAVRWIAQDGTSRSAETVIREIARFLARDATLRPVFLRSDIRTRYTSVPIADAPVGTVRSGVDYGWHLVSIDPIVLVGVPEPFQFETTAACLTPFGIAHERQDGLLFGYGVFASATVPAGESPFWCSPTHGIGPVLADIDGDGGWTIRLPDRRLAMARIGSTWRLVASTAMTGAPDDTIATAPRGRSPTSTSTPSRLSDADLLGSWTGDLGTLSVHLTLGPSGTGTITFVYAMFARRFERRVVEWTVTEDGNLRLDIEQQRQATSIRPAVWTGSASEESLVILMTPSLDASRLDRPLDGYRIALKRARTPPPDS